MGRKRKDSSKTVIDPKLLPPNLTPPPPPDLKLQVRGNPNSGYRVCTYFAQWRPVVKGTDTSPRKEGSCVATHVKTVGYIEKHKRSGKIIFVPDFYFEVPSLRYYDVYRDYDHCTYQLRSDWRESWYLTERDIYQPPEESRNLKQELSRLRKLVSAQKRAAAQGIALELDLEAPTSAQEVGAQGEGRSSYNQYMMGSIPTTDALHEGVYRVSEQERVGPSLAAQYALAVGESAVTPNIVPAIAKAGKRAPARAEAPGPDAYLSLTDDPNAEWHVKSQHEVLPPSQPQELRQRQAELDKILDPQQSPVPQRKSSAKYRPAAQVDKSLRDAVRPNVVLSGQLQASETILGVAPPNATELAGAQPSEAGSDVPLAGTVLSGAQFSEAITDLALSGAAGTEESLIAAVPREAESNVAWLGAAKPDEAQSAATAPSEAALEASRAGRAEQYASRAGWAELETALSGAAQSGAVGVEGVGAGRTVLGQVQRSEKLLAEATSASLPLAGAPRFQSGQPASQTMSTLPKSTTKYRPKSSLQRAAIVNVGTLRLQGPRKLHPDDEEQ